MSDVGKKCFSSLSQRGAGQGNMETDRQNPFPSEVTTVVPYHQASCYLIPCVSEFNNRNKHLEVFFFTVNNLEVSQQENHCTAEFELQVFLGFGHKIIILQVTLYSFCWKYLKIALIIICTHYICENLLYRCYFLLKDNWRLCSTNAPTQGGILSVYFAFMNSLEY